MGMQSGRGKFGFTALAVALAFAIQSPAIGAAQSRVNATTNGVSIVTGNGVTVNASATTNAPQARQPASPEKLAAILKFVFENEAQKHGWPANYTALWCPTNVFNLLRRLDEAKVDLSAAQVLYIVPAYYAGQKGDSSVRPRAARVGAEGAVREWTFHVVLLIDDKILDLDFTNSPVVVSKDDYFARMFGKGPLATQPAKPALFLRSIPADDYYSSYTGNWEWYARGAGGRYPALNLETLWPQDVGLAASNP
jgi:hypothetical protein